MGFIGIAFVAFIAFFVWQSRAKTKWGINLKPIACPKCGASGSRLRTPKTRQQALWGGRTCSDCGQEMDKWGRPTN